MSEKKKTVLVVDDDNLVQTTFKLLLESKGYQVLLANDGNHALQQLESARVDAVLLDILMPDREGIETLIEIKRRQPRTRVLVMSGGGIRTKHDFLSVAAKFGADATIKKALGTTEILNIVDSHLQSAA
jgi:CheY-like chemotaxis protein